MKVLADQYRWAPPVIGPGVNLDKSMGMVTLQVKAGVYQSKSIEMAELQFKTAVYLPGSVLMGMVQEIKAGVNWFVAQALVNTVKLRLLGWKSSGCTQKS